MGTRLQLQTLLKTLTDNVYFQPPSDHQMDYPCIRYRRDDARTTHADNLPYLYKKRYQITVIDLDPDSEIPDKVAKLPMCTFNRHYVVDNLNHDVFNIYF
jgi:hypothetical protein